jgi:ribonuclease-3
LREGHVPPANLVRQEALHRLAEGLKLGEYLRLGEGELKSGGHRRPSILADALEAIFAAVFLDAGFEAAKVGDRSAVRHRWPASTPPVPSRIPKPPCRNGCRAGACRCPIRRPWRAHQQEFEVECEITGLGLKTRGIGVSRRAAEQQSAQRALELPAKVMTESSRPFRTGFVAIVGRPNVGKSTCSTG